MNYGASCLYFLISGITDMSWHNAVLSTRDLNSESLMHGNQAFYLSAMSSTRKCCFLKRKSYHMHRAIYFLHLVNMVCVCMCALMSTHVFCSMHVEAREQLSGVGSLLLPYWSWGPSPGCGAQNLGTDLTSHFPRS